MYEKLPSMPKKVMGRMAEWLKSILGRRTDSFNSNISLVSSKLGQCQRQFMVCHNDYLKHLGLAAALKITCEKSSFMSYLSYELHCCMLPDKHCLSHGMCLYMVIMTLHFLNDVTNDTESKQKLKITS